MNFKAIGKKNQHVALVVLQNLYEFMNNLLLPFVVGERVYVCSPGCPETQFVDYTSLKLRDPSASVSQVLGLNSCAQFTIQFIHG